MGSQAKAVVYAGDGGIDVPRLHKIIALTEFRNYNNIS